MVAEALAGEQGAGEETCKVLSTFVCCCIMSSVCCLSWSEEVMLSFSLGWQCVFVVYTSYVVVVGRVCVII